MRSARVASEIVVRWTPGAVGAAGALLRRAVAARTGTSIDNVSLKHVCPWCGGPHGRPVVDVGGRRPPHVSLAHAGDMVIVAVASRPVGVDLEPIRGHHVPVPAGELRHWVRREAILKATGLGLTVDHELVSVIDGSRGEGPRLDRWDVPHRRPRVRLVDVDAIPGFLAAVACLGNRRPVLDASAERR